MKETPSSSDYSGCSCRHSLRTIQAAMVEADASCISQQCSKPVPALIRLAEASASDSWVLLSNRFTQAVSAVNCCSKYCLRRFLWKELFLTETGVTVIDFI